MKRIAALPFAVALAIALAACGAGHHTPRPAATVATSPQASPAASPAASAVSANTNERLFADGMAASIPVVPVRVVAGAVMHAYVRFQHANGAAAGAVGQPNPSERVTQIGGGFKLCWPDTGNG